MVGEVFVPHPFVYIFGAVVMLIAIHGILNFSLKDTLTPTIQVSLNFVSWHGVKQRLNLASNVITHFTLLSCP